MREHKQSRIILSLLLGFILLALCLPVCAFAEDAELSDGDETGISLTTSVPPSVISGTGAAYQKGSASGLTFKTDDATDNLLRVLVDGQVVSPENYTVSGEPLAVTLRASFLDSLPTGEHTIEIVTANGSAVCVFRSMGASSSSGGGGGSGTAAYSVIMPSTATHGRAVSSAASARPGETVTITVTPDQGWQTAAVTVKDYNGKAVPVTDRGGGVWSFTMPNGRVSVSYSFTESKDAPGGMGCPRDRTCPISRFTDASPDQWYHDGVHWALTKGVMNGVGGGRFAPNGTATRAMVVTMLWRLEGEPGGKISPFHDVPTDEWYTRAVNWAAETGVVKGITKTEFAPNAPVTREQLAAILYRYAQTKGQGFTGMWYFPLDFKDAAKVSEYADEAMHWMVMKGIIQGRTETTLNPKERTTRAEIATMFMRYLTGIGAE